MLILYDFGNSVCCQKVRITLCEKGLDWEARPVNLFKSEQYDPAYLKLNPKGVVPTLVHDGKPVNESTLICEYIDETFPEPPLMPTEPWQRSHARLWSKLVDEGLFEGVVEFSFSAMFRERLRHMPADLREKRMKGTGDPRRNDRFKSTYELGVDSPHVLYAIAAYETAFKRMEADSGREWPLADRPARDARRYCPHALRRAPRLPQAARHLDRRPTARMCLVGTGAGMAKLQARPLRPRHR